jgi:hypothetical protein
MRCRRIRQLQTRLGFVLLGKLKQNAHRQGASASWARRPRRGLTGTRFWPGAHDEEANARYTGHLLMGLSRSS